jgi:hypothetical protein
VLVFETAQSEGQHRTRRSVQPLSIVNGHQQWLWLREQSERCHERRGEDTWIGTYRVRLLERQRDRERVPLRHRELGQQVFRCDTNEITEPSERDPRVCSSRPRRQNMQLLRPCQSDPLGPELRLADSGRATEKERPRAIGESCHQCVDRFQLGTAPDGCTPRTFGDHHH